ncbi:MAG: hypothetical protein ACYC91_19805 [Solirubrobacteraceae bacterium]
MIDNDRQLPTPSADAWSVDLSGLGGPRFVILTLSESRARELLAEHLVELGQADTTTAAAELISEMPCERVSVIW